MACYNFVTRAWHEGMVFQAAEGHRPHSICRSLNEQSIIAVSGEIYKNGVMAGSVPYACSPHSDASFLPRH